MSVSRRQFALALATVGPALLAARETAAQDP
jgi:hypothetical protein